MKAVTAALSLLATLVLSAPAGAVDNGVPDRDAHPNVGLLAFDVDGEGPTPPFAFCTGSVISDDAFPDRCPLHRCRPRRRLGCDARRR